MHKIQIRVVELQDSPKMMEWENRKENWTYSQRNSAYSFHEILDLIDSSNDFELNQQIRFVILKSETAIGTLDFFNHNVSNKSVEVGVLIANEEDRRKSYASEALEMGIHEMKKKNIVCFIAKIQKGNPSSLRLFEKLLFVKTADSENPRKFEIENQFITLQRCEKSSF